MSSEDVFGIAMFIVLVVSGAIVLYGGASGLWREHRTGVGVSAKNVILAVVGIAAFTVASIVFVNALYDDKPEEHAPQKSGWSRVNTNDLMDP